MNYLADSTVLKTRSTFSKILTGLHKNLFFKHNSTQKKQQHKPINSNRSHNSNTGPINGTANRCNNTTIIAIHAWTKTHLNIKVHHLVEQLF